MAETYLKMKSNYTIESFHLTNSMTLNLQETRKRVKFFRENEEGWENLTYEN